MEAYDVTVHYNVNLVYSGARPETISRIFFTQPYNALVINPEGNLVACYEIVDNLQPLFNIPVLGRIKNDKIIIS
jgi:hypothetical protein